MALAKLPSLPKAQIPALANIGAGPFLLGTFLFWIASHGRAAKYLQFVSAGAGAGKSPVDVAGPPAPTGPGAEGANPTPSAPASPVGPMFDNPASKALRDSLGAMGVWQ